MVVKRKKKSKAAKSATFDNVRMLKRIAKVQAEIEQLNEKFHKEVSEVQHKYNQIRRPVYLKRNGIIKSIASFWFTVFSSHPALGDFISEEDRMIFQHLDSVDVENFREKSGYSLIFNFKPNPFFENDTLVKKFMYVCDDKPKVTGSKIMWKEEMGTNRDDSKKEGNKQAHSYPSFFSWFSESQLQNITGDLHDEVAVVIKDDLWPNPLKYINDEA